MASKSIDWDELLLTNDPKKKEIEVSFKKIDGEGFLISKGDQPGSPGGLEEDPNGDTNSNKDPEGDYEDIDNGGGGGGGDPVDPGPDAHPECGGVDCTAYDNYALNSTAEFKATDFLLYDGFQSGLDRDAELGGTIVTFQTNNPAVLDPSINTQKIVDGGVFSYGPCVFQGPQKYGIAPWTGGNLGSRRSVPEQYYNDAYALGSEGEVNLSGAWGIYIWDQNLDGSTRTSGTRSASHYFKPIMTDIMNPSSFYTGSIDALLSVVFDYSTGTGYITGGGLGSKSYLSSNTMTGAYTVEWNLVYKMVPIIYNGDLKGFPQISLTVKFSGNGASFVVTKANQKTIADGLPWDGASVDGNDQVFLQYAGTSPIIGAAGYNNGNQANIQKLMDWKKDIERAMQDYLPPDYCVRIP